MTDVREPGVRGVFARPPGQGPFGEVVAFGGSSGGLGSAAAWAPMLASHGFAVLAIAYFGVPGLPDRLAKIPVETVERAAAWLLARDDVGLDRVAVMGQSRGGELALLAGASLDVIGAVVGVVPSGVVWCGFGAAGPLDVSAWSVGGRPVPYLPAVDGFPSGVGASEPVAMTPGFARLLRDEAAVRAAASRSRRCPGRRRQGMLVTMRLTAHTWSTDPRDRGQHQTVEREHPRCDQVKHAAAQETASVRSLRASRQHAGRWRDGARMNIGGTAGE